MAPRNEAFTTVNIELSATIRRHGHVVPIENGKLVRCMYADVAMYEELHDDLRTSYDHSSLRMCDAGPGFVMGHRYHVPKWELVKAKIDPVYDGQRTVPHLIDVNENLWYCVAFRDGMFWALYHWIEEVEITP